MRSASEWAQARAMAADGLSQREVAARLGINRRTVRRMLDSSGPPRYQRAPRGSMLDPLEPVLRRLLRDWPEIKTPRVTEILRSDHGYTGSVDLVRRRLESEPVDALSCSGMGSRLAVSRWRGAERQARGESVLVGGHIDSVPGSGWLDGALNLLAGVVLRSEVMQVLGDLPV